MEEASVWDKKLLSPPDWWSKHQLVWPQSHTWPPGPWSDWMDLEMYERLNFSKVLWASGLIITTIQKIKIKRPPWWTLLHTVVQGWARWGKGHISILYLSGDTQCILILFRDVLVAAAEAPLHFLPEANPSKKQSTSKPKTKCHTGTFNIYLHNIKCVKQLRQK